MDQEQQQQGEEQEAQQAIEQGEDAAPAAAPDAAASTADDGAATMPEAQAAAGDVFKDLYDDASTKAKADDGQEPPAEDQAEAKGDAESPEGKSLVDKAKDMAMKGASRKAVTAVVEKTAARAGLSALGKCAGPIGGALVDGAMAAKDNIDAYRDGRISAGRAITNTLAEGAIGAASGMLGPVGGGAARYALGKFARWTGIIKDPEKKAE